jgi:hypothetical protein
MAVGWLVVLTSVLRALLRSLRACPKANTALLSLNEACPGESLEKALSTGIFFPFFTLLHSLSVMIKSR